MSKARIFSKLSLAKLLKGEFVLLALLQIVLEKRQSKFDILLALISLVEK